MKKCFLLALALVAIAPRARADAEKVPETKEPPKPRRGSDLVTFQLEDAELPEIVKTMNELTGKNFVVATAKPKTIKASVYAPQKVTVDEAYRAFLAVLQQNGLTVVPGGAFQKIVESQDAARVTPIVPDAPPEERYVTRLHRLAHAGADEVAALLAKLQTRDGSVIPYAAGNLLIMTDTGTNLRRMLQVVEEIDVGGAGEKLYIEPLYYASSSDVEKRLTELFDLKQKIDGPSAGELKVRRVVAIERPNALAIVATEPSYARLLEVLRRIDVPVTSEGQIHVVALQHADAKKIVGPLNEALGGAAAAAPTSPGAPPGAGQPVRPGALSVLESAVKVSADETTNSLLVTSSPRDFAAIKAVIDRLDMAKRQVYIEAVVMDVSASRGLDLGVAWHGGGVEQNALGPNKDAFAYGGFRAANSALPPNPTDLQAFALGVRGPEIPLPFPIGIGQSSVTSIPSLGAFITAAATTSGTDILSTPSIVASDNTAAELKVQLNTSATPHAPPASIIAGGIGVPAPPSPTAGRLTIGPRIKVTPHLNDSDEVRIDVEEVISDVASAPDKGDVYGSISFIERAASTTTTVKDGETVVIAGLVRNKSQRIESKVPILGDVPLLGALFRTSSETTEKSNLVLVMTPHIIRDQSDMRRIVERVEQERQDMIDHEVIFGETWKAPVDYAHTRGLLFRMRKETRILKEKERLEEMRAPREVKEHGGTAPIDLPTPTPTWGGGNPAPPAAPARPAVDKVER